MSRLYSRAASVAILSLLLGAWPAYGHVTLETAQTSVGGSYKAVFRVPHGCKGSPTVALRVRIPEGVIGVKPQPKAGWTLNTRVGQYAQAYTLYGAQVESGVQEVSWAGGSLPDDHYDEFVLLAYLSDALKPGSTLYFPVVQECKQGVERWIDVPQGGAGEESAGHAGSPAPGVKLLSTP